MSFLNYIVKWLHLLSIIGVLGATATAYLVLNPVLKGRGEGDAAAEVTAALWKKWGLLLMAGWGVVLLTGFYNYVVVGATVIGTYHAFAGAKIALALVMLLVTGLVAHPGVLSARFKQDRGEILLIALVIGVILVGISAHLNLSRLNGNYVKKDSPAPATTPAPFGLPTTPAPATPATEPTP